MPGLSERLRPIRNTASGGLLALLLLLAGIAQAGGFSVIGTSRWVQVAHVIDGDTFAAANGERIRLLGINTPEVAHDREPGQPGGTEAKQRLTTLIGGKTVQLIPDRDRRDSYGRLLAQVYLQDGSWINGRLVREGYAHVYTFAPNFRWAGELLQAESQARRQRLGIWAQPRFRVLQGSEVSRSHVGQFRIVEGAATDISSWSFRLGSLTVTVPRKYRQWFAAHPLPAAGQHVRIRATIRVSAHGGLFAALHSPYDLEIMP